MNVPERLERDMERIARITGDPESYHFEEDRFLVRVLRGIAEGRLEGDEAREAAAIAVRLARTERTRWYA